MCNGRGIRRSLPALTHWSAARELLNRGDKQSYPVGSRRRSVSPQLRRFFKKEVQKNEAFRVGRRRACDTLVNGM